MKKLIPILVFFGLVFIDSDCIGQSNIQPAWSAKFNKPITWQQVHPLGYIIACTSEGLYGVNPTDGKIMWKNPAYAGIDQSMISEVEGTALLAITYKKDPNSSIPLQALIEVTAGKVLFDSQKEQIGVMSKHVLPLSNRLLVIGVKKGDLKDMAAALYMYDIQSGNQLWENEELFKVDKSAAKGFFAKLQAFSQQMGNIQGLIGDPVEVDAENIIITHPGYVIKLASATGDVVWKNKIQTATKAAVYFSPYKKGVTYVATEIESETGSGFTTSSGGQNGQQKFIYNVYYAFNTGTGASLWKKPAKEKDHLNLVIMQENGIIICPYSERKPTINLINYETGATMWGKKGNGIKAQGSVVSYIPTSNGILITTTFDNPWNNKAEEYYLNILDPTAGELKYKKSVKLKGDLVSSSLVPKGLLFVTTREVNILDINTGDLIWDKSIEAGTAFMSGTERPLPTAQDEKYLYAFSPKEDAMFKVDKQAGNYVQLSTEKIKFQGKELPKEIDIVGDGLILSSEQNIAKIGNDGSTKFMKYYAAPREKGLMRALLLAESVRAAYIGTAATMYSAAFDQASQKATDPNAKAVGQELAKGFNQLGQAGFAYSGEAMKQFKARFKASRNTASYVIMMTKQDKKGNQLIQVSKKDGSMLNSIDIKNDKEPEYDLDVLYNQVYYKPSSSEIVCYKL